LHILNHFGNRCAICGSHGCQAAHIAPRRFKHLRHHPYNGIALCPDCHADFDGKDKQILLDWISLRHPERFRVYEMRHEVRGPVSLLDLQATVSFLSTL